MNPTLQALTMMIDRLAVTEKVSTDPNARRMATDTLNEVVVLVPQLGAGITQTRARYGGLEAVDSIAESVELAVRYGQIDGAHHKAWVIDQMVRKLTGPEYADVVRRAKAGENGPDTFAWDEGVAP